MAGLFAFLSVQRALDKLRSLVSGLTTSSSSQTSTTCHDQDLEDLNMLERTMGRIHATLHDAEEHWDIREESSKLRLRELKDLAYDAADVVEGYEYKVNRCKVEALERSAAASDNGKRKRQDENGTNPVVVGAVAVPNDLAVQARKIIQRFNEITYYHQNFSLSENDGQRRFTPDISSFRESSSLVYEKSILGREKDKERIVKLMLSENTGSPVSVMAIVGMGGLGKTTLAQLVYNDPLVRESFDVHAWVCVSDQFDVKNITRKIINSLLGAEYNASELGSLQEKLMNNVKDKKVLLVMDDVWSERRDLWEQLCQPMFASSLCRIILTTRSEEVARVVQTIDIYRIDFLSSDESWILFKQVVFAAEQGNNIPRNLAEIGKSIVEKCKGLPLAIKTLGSMLRYTTDEMRWRHVLKSDLWELEQPGKGVLAALELSYKYMPTYLKPCFVALSLYTKDCEIHKYDVIEIWRLLDLLQSDENEDDYEIGSQYFGELVQRSFLQVNTEKDYSMHDLIHDLARYLGAGEFFRIDRYESTEIPPNARYISTSADDGPFKYLTTFDSVRAIIMFGGQFHMVHRRRGNDYLAAMQSLILNCKKLRALRFVGSIRDMALLPDFMRDLKLLRHLSINFIQRTHNVDTGQVVRFHMPPLSNLRTLEYWDDSWGCNMFICGDVLIQKKKYVEMWMDRRCTESGA